MEILCEWLTLFLSTLDSFENVARRLKQMWWYSYFHRTIDCSLSLMNTQWNSIELPMKFSYMMDFNFFDWSLWKYLSWWWKINWINRSIFCVFVTISSLLSDCLRSCNRPDGSPIKTVALPNWIEKKNTRRKTRRMKETFKYNYQCNRLMACTLPM